MGKIVSVRERVHQPFFDSLIRTAGTQPGSVQDKTALFVSGGVRTDAITNLNNGSTLPSDQSHVTLALRVFTWFKAPRLRTTNPDNVNVVSANGDYGSLAAFQADGQFVGNAPATIYDVYRLAWQVEEAVHWNFGTGLKNSIFNMPTWYFPAGGGMTTSIGGQTDLLHVQNQGSDGHSGILRLARAVLIPPRQNIVCDANMFNYPLENNSQNLFGTNQGARNMYSVRDNLNVVDLMSKVVQFYFDGLFSRDVQ
jgi:hypothetical protein